MLFQHTYLWNVLSPGTPYWWIIVGVLACYLYGSIPFAYIFTYLFTRQKITEIGTKNVGVANTFGVAGLKAGLLTVAGEMSKAALALSLAHLLDNDGPALALIFVFAAMLGTAFSIFLKGKGGMGTTILLFTLVWLSPYSFLLFGAFFIVLYLTLKDSFYTSISGYLLLPVALFLIEGKLSFVVFGLAVAALYLSRYRRHRDDYALHVKGRNWRSIFR